MKKQVFHRKWLVLFFVNVLIVFLACGLMLNLHFSPDTHGMWNMTDNDVSSHLRNGRFVTALISKLLAAVGINVARSQSALVLLFMLTVAALAALLACRVVQIIGREDVLTLAGTDAAMLLLFHNALLAEWYIFGECMLMYAVSIACAVWSVLLYRRVVSAKRAEILRHISASFLALTLSLGTYQVSIGIYVGLLLLFVFIEKANIRKKLLLAAGGLALGALGCAANLFIVKLLTWMHITPPTGRGAALDLSTILSNIRALIAKQPEIWRGYGIFPVYLLPVFFLCAAALFLYAAIRRRVPRSTVLLAVVFSLCIYAGSFIPHLVAADFWVSHRTLVPLFAVFSFWIIAFFSVEPISLPERRIAASLALVFLLGNSLLMEDIFSNHLAMDDLDTAYAKAINNYIADYSEKNGDKITHVALAWDEQVTWSYDGIDYVSYDLNTRNILRSWTNVPLINYTNHTDYQKADMDPDVWEDFFAGKDWDHFLPEEQIVFRNHTAYIAIY